jgi:NAD(P)-dependent dehydrogenase (short-subunit alcohol dehydrogenase family)
MKAGAIGAVSQSVTDGNADPRPMRIQGRFLRRIFVEWMQSGWKTMADRLKDKVALVVGAGSIGPGWGNGKATAVTFAREGAKVLCVDINLEAAEETVGIIKRERGDARAFQGDVTNTADVAAMTEACLNAYSRIDVLVNNVGIAAVGGVVDVSEEEWDRVMAINLKSCFLGMKHVIPIMESKDGGSIINISSIASIRYTGVPYATYYASKAAMNHLTRTTAAQYAPKKIRVNAILPGLMETPMVLKSAGLVTAYGGEEEVWKARSRQVPMGFGGNAWDVAYAALYLSSDESRYVTGLELVVDGGVTLKYA